MISHTKFVEKSIILPSSWQASIEDSVLHNTSSDEVIWREKNGKYYITPFSEMGVPYITGSTGGIGNKILLYQDYQASFYTASIAYVSYNKDWFLTNSKITKSSFSLHDEYQTEYTKLVSEEEHDYISYSGDSYYELFGLVAIGKGELKPDYDVTADEYDGPIPTFELEKCEFDNITWDVLSSSSRFGEYESPTGQTRIIGFERFKDLASQKNYTKYFGIILDGSVWKIGKYESDTEPTHDGGSFTFTNPDDSEDTISITFDSFVGEPQDAYYFQMGEFSQ